MAKKEIDITQHELVPKHTKVSDKEKEQALEEYGITVMDLPKIKMDDPAINHLDAKAGDVIRIERPSPTAGTTVFYRVVVNE